MLPLANPGGVAEEAYLSDGITEDIITGLSRFGRLAVLGMASSNAYRDRSADLDRLATELGVDYAVQGSVRRASNIVRLSAQLVDARSGLTLWAERYDRVIDNLFAAQDEISETIVSTLAGQLEQEAAAAASRKRTENMEAYDFLLRGIHPARALDPNCGGRRACHVRESAGARPRLRARACLVRADEVAPLGVAAKIRHGQDEMLTAAQRALALDPSESWCHLVFGQIMMYRRQLAEANSTTSVPMN